MQRSTRLQQTAEGYTQANLFASVEWRIRVGNTTLSEGISGSSDGAGAALPAKPLYRIFSMTKPVVSVLALMLVERGKLRLYDMVAQYDPQFAALAVLNADGSLTPAHRPVTIEDLLTHRAGFTYEFIHGCPVAQYYREAEITADGRRSLPDMMEALATLPLAHQPGSQFRYSVCIDVLAHVIEQVMGESLETILQRELFGPLNMQDTGFAVADDQQDRLLPMFGTGDLTQGPPQLAPAKHELHPLDASHINPADMPGEFRRGGLGLFATMDDYEKFARMLLDGQGDAAEPILSRTTLQMLRENRIPTEQLPLRIGMAPLPGYGWGLIGRVHLGPGQALGLGSTGEFGWAGAATTYFWVDPQEQMTGLVMTQFLGAMLPLVDDMRTAAYQALS